jgi:DNA-binding NarL/FixJ family response regulator
VVLMDMELPQVHGLDATRAIVQENPATKVLVLSSSDDRTQVMAAVRAGAAGYLLKTAGSAEIQDGVRRVHAGELVFPPELASFVLAELRGDSKRSVAGDPLAELTERERGVLSLMAEGHTNEAIGERLHISPKTIEANVTAIFEKLGIGEVAGGHKRVLAVIAYLNAAAKQREVP